MKKILILLVLVFITNPAQSQDLEKLFGSKEIVVCSFDFFTLDMKGFGVDEKSIDVVGISALKIDVTTGKVLAEFNQKVAAGVFMATYLPYAQIANVGIIVKRVITENNLLEGITTFSALTQLKAFAGDLPIHTYNDNDFLTVKDVLAKKKAANRQIFQGQAVEPEFPITEPFVASKALLTSWGHDLKDKKLNQLPELLGKSNEVISAELGMNPDDNSLRKNAAGFAVYLLEAGRTKSD